jgi:hypothetical protein
MPGTNSYGTATTLDTLRVIDNASVYQYGEDQILQAVQLELQAHNAQMAEAVGALAEDTRNNADRGYGAPGQMEMTDVDEVGVPHTQNMVINPPGNIGYPLRRSKLILQWDLPAFERMTPAELAMQVDAATDADTRRTLRNIKRALFLRTDYNFKDRWDRGLILPVKRLVNADGYYIPTAPNGTTFDPNVHTHYLATASLVAGDVSALISTVIEHYDTGAIRLIIPKASEPAIRTFTTNFVALLPPNQVAGIGTSYVNGTLDVMNPTNRLIGYWDGNEVWVKPWAITNYLFAYNTGVRKPLKHRLPQIGNGAFRMIYQDEDHKLRAQAFQREDGFGVRERTNGAVLYTGGGTWVDPTIT